MATTNANLWTGNVVYATQERINANKWGEGGSQIVTLVCSWLIFFGLVFVR